VHQRLDSETSGLVVLTTDPRANGGLAHQIEKHEVRKRYLAIASTEGGHVPDSFVVDAPIGESAGARRGRMSVVPNGPPASTTFRVVERMPRAVLLEAEPTMGRKHQIRVHLAFRGLPILGDAVHAPGAVRRRAARLMLHAAELELRHPLTGEGLRLVCQPPSDFEETLKRERRAEPRALPAARRERGRGENGQTRRSLASPSSLRSRRHSG
jgi:23S rRNA pseudouridine1911/1915/1917 synthase